MFVWYYQETNKFKDKYLLVPGDDKVWIVWTEKKGQGNKKEGETFLIEIMELIEDSINPPNWLIKTILKERVEEEETKETKVP